MASDPGEHTLKGQELESLKEKFQQQVRGLETVPVPNDLCAKFKKDTAARFVMYPALNPSPSIFWRLACVP